MSGVTGQTVDHDQDDEQDERDPRSVAGGAPPRVAFLLTAYHPVYGGGLIRIRRFLPHLTARGVEAFVVAGPLAGHPHHEVVDGHELFRVRTPRLPGPLAGPGLFLATLRELRQLRHRLDVIHAVGVSWLQMAGAAYGRSTGRPVIMEPTLQGGDDPQTVARRRVAPIFLPLYRGADRVVALSSALEQGARAGGIDPARIERIPNGIDVDRFSPPASPDERRSLRRQLGLPETGTLTVMVGELHRRKGVDILVEAWARVHARHPDAHLALFGPVRDRDEGQRFVDALRGRISALGLEGRVHIQGEIDAVQEALRAADLFALPTEAEGLPNVVLEAMACGLPSVVTDLPGIMSDIFQSPDQGRPVAERTPEAFAEAIVDLLDDAGLRSQMGHAARQRVVDGFSAQRRARLCEDLYRRLLSDRSRPQQG